MIIEIPGEITFSRTYKIPPIPVELPLTVHARTFWQGTRAVVGLCLTLPMLALWVFALAYFGRLPEVSLWRSFVVWTATSVVLLLLLPLTIVRIVDFTRRGPVLILEPQGFTDRRGSISLLWSDISSAQIIYMMNHTGVRLGLRNSIPPRALFDRGGTGLLGRRKADVYEVSVGDLSERAYVLSQTMLFMIGQNSGTVKR